MLQLKIKPDLRAEWHFYGCSTTLQIEFGKSLFTRYSKKYGYKFHIVELDGHFYVTQALYESPNDYQTISVHYVPSVSDARQIIEVMTRLIKEQGDRKYANTIA